MADVQIYQAHFTSCQTKKERDRKRRWLTDPYASAQRVYAST
jgi:hypothetical protein